MSKSKHTARSEYGKRPLKSTQHQIITRNIGNTNVYNYIEANQYQDHII